MAKPAGARLQGSCCFAMDRAAYRRQVDGLGAYAALPEIPRDPYDIPAVLAKRLLGYRSIPLTDREQAVYAAAMRASPERGPCCCQCWRADAFSGLARELIARRRWPAARLGHVIGLLDGCGGRA